MQIGISTSHQKFGLWIYLIVKQFVLNVIGGLEMWSDDAVHFLKSCLMFRPDGILDTIAVWRLLQDKYLSIFYTSLF